MTFRKIPCHPTLPLDFTPGDIPQPPLPPFQIPPRLPHRPLHASAFCNIGVSLPREGRNWARELQTVRSKWAHLSAQTMPASDVYRDADTLGRFLDMLGAKSESVAAVEAAKTAALDDMAVARNVVPGSSAPVGEISSPADQEMNQTGATVSSVPSATTFRVGDLVALRSNPGTVVPTIEVLYRWTREWKYLIRGDAVDGRRMVVVSKLGATDKLVVITAWVDDEKTGM